VGSGSARINLALKLCNKVGNFQCWAHLHAQQWHDIVLGQLQESLSVDLDPAERVTVGCAIVHPQELGYVVHVPCIRHQLQVRFTRIDVGQTRNVLIIRRRGVL